MGRIYFNCLNLTSCTLVAFKQLGFSKSINKTRLKQQFLEHFMEAKEETDGKKVLLVFREGIKEILKDAVKEIDFSEDALILAKAAKILTNDILTISHSNLITSFRLIARKTLCPLLLIKWYKLSSGVTQFRQT